MTEAEDLLFSDELKGQTFGYLTLTGRYRSSRSSRRVEANCSCGSALRMFRIDRLKTGHVKSCGCYKTVAQAQTHKTHGQCYTRLYNVWGKMRTRCQKKADPAYIWYGARGIQVCEAWRESFQAFADWAESTGYRPGLTLDRIDNDGDYEPSNCRWATRKTQSRNQSTNRLVTAFGETKCLAEWVEDPRCAVSASCLRARIHSGSHEPEAAITEPARSSKFARAVGVEGA